jgi:hypothetical protein
MKHAFKTGISALLVTLGLGTMEPGQACEPHSDVFSTLFSTCDTYSFELSGACTDIGGGSERRGLMNVAQPYASETRLEFISFGLTSPTGAFAPQFLTLARADNACPGATPANTGNGCKMSFNVGQPPGPPTLFDIVSLDQAMLSIPGVRQNVYFNVSCNSLSPGIGLLVGKPVVAVGIVGWTKNGDPATCDINSKVKVQERRSEVVKEPAPCI